MRVGAAAGYVAYYRVSTGRQRASGLGLEAQRAAVASYLAGGAPLLAEHTEIESGRRHANRPELAAAISLCRRRKATLLIARLDRLARSVAFISALMESDVDFLAADMPQASRLTIHILAAVAEHERELISTRTREALAAAKARGTVLGNPRLHEARARAAALRPRHEPAPELVTLIVAWRGQGWTLRAIADELGRLGIRTAGGAPLHASRVGELLRRQGLAAAPA